MATTQIPFDNNPSIEFRQAEKPAETDAKEEPKKKWTPEDLEEMAKATMKSFGWEGELPKKEKKPAPAAESEATPAEEKALSTPENEPETPAEEKPAKPARKAQAKEDKPDMADRIAAKISEENEKLLARISPQKPVGSAEDERTASSGARTEQDAENEHLKQVFATMASMSPANKELPRQFDEFLKRETVYQREWEKENPGKTYDPGADEHEDWYEKNQPAYDERQFNRAQVTVEAERLIAEREIKAQSKNAIEHAVSIAETSMEASTEALEADVKAKLTEILGENTILDNEGPIAEKYQSVLASLNDKVTTASVLMTPGVGVQFDPRNPVHAAVQKEVIEFDADIAALTEAEQRQLISTALGKKSRLLTKKFVPAVEYQNLSEVDRAKVWNICVEPALVAKLMTVKAKESLNGWLDTLFNQVGKKPANASASESTPKAQPKTAETPTPASSKPSPPGLGQGASSVTSQSGSPTKSGNSWEDIANNF